MGHIGVGDYGPLRSDEVISTTPQLKGTGSRSRVTN